MSRSISIEELNKRVDRMIYEYEDEFLHECDPTQAIRLKAKIEVLEELKIDLNDPEAVEDIAENVQQTLNVIETKKIIDNEL